MNNSNHIKNELSVLTELIPNVDTKDIKSLLDDVVDVYNKAEAPKSIDEWTPLRATVKEILKLNVQIKDLTFCIENFKTFAKSKKWSPEENLDAKLVAHIKIMEQNGKIKFEITE